MLQDFDVYCVMFPPGSTLTGPKVCVPSFQGVTRYISAYGGLLAKGFGWVGMKQTLMYTYSVAYKFRGTGDAV